MNADKIRAVLLDVDGTMYDQSALRWRMVPSLCRAGWRALRIIRAYRRAQESLRGGLSSGDAQVEVTCRETGYDSETVRACVTRWMEEAPLRHLPRCVDPGLRDFLEWARGAGIRLAVCSDYPASAKLEALGVGEFFGAVVCAHDVGRFKPHPRMIEVALERLGVGAEEAVFVGDRPEVDGVAAQRAGVRYVDVGSVTFRELIYSLSSRGESL